MTLDVTGEIVAVVPVRGLPAGKRRLAARLSTEQRNSLVRAMLDDVVGALLNAASIDRVVICSRDVAAHVEGDRLGVDFLDQADQRPGYNGAIARAQADLAAAEALLIAPADVPLITPDAVDLVVATAPDGEAVVVAPAHNGGTNGLFVRPPGIIRPAFGPSSARAHAQAASDAGVAGVPFRLAQIDVWAYDVDTPADLDHLERCFPSCPTRSPPTPEPGSRWSGRWGRAAESRPVQTTRAYRSRSIASRHQPSFLRTPSAPPPVIPAYPSVIPAPPSFLSFLRIPSVVPAHPLRHSCVPDPSFLRRQESMRPRGFERASDVRRTGSGSEAAFERLAAPSR